MKPKNTHTFTSDVHALDRVCDYLRKMAVEGTTENDYMELLHELGHPYGKEEEQFTNKNEMFLLWSIVLRTQSGIEARKECVKLAIREIDRFLQYSKDNNANQQFIRDDFEKIVKILSDKM